MSGGNKFSAEVPKGDGWGVDKAVAAAVKKILNGEKSPLIPVIGVIDIKAVTTDPETGNVIATVRVRRLESLDDLETIREGQRVLMRAWAAKRGEGAMLPFEEKEFIERAFDGFDVAEIEQDEKEALEDQDLSESDRLRKHLQTVHGWEETDIRLAMEDSALRQEHVQEHEVPEPSYPQHDVEWWAWRRVDLDAAESAVEDEPADSDDSSHPAADHDGQMEIPEFKPPTE
jgi:hypothetical protein